MKSALPDAEVFSPGDFPRSAAAILWPAIIAARMVVTVMKRKRRDSRARRLASRARRESMGHSLGDGPINVVSKRWNPVARHRLLKSDRPGWKWLVVSTWDGSWAGRGLLTLNDYVSGSDS